jgi:plastocyanin
MLRRMRPGTAIVVPAAAVAGRRASPGPRARSRSATNYFVRESSVPVVNASKNKRVTFEFVGRFMHDVKATKGPVKFQSGPISFGSFKTPKLKKGDYKVICEIHGAADMSMKLKVR